MSHSQYEPLSSDPSVAASSAFPWPNCTSFDPPHPSLRNEPANYPQFIDHLPEVKGSYGHGTNAEADYNRERRWQSKMGRAEPRGESFAGYSAVLEFYGCLGRSRYDGREPPLCWLGGYINLGLLEQLANEWVIL